YSGSSAYRLRARSRREHMYAIPRTEPAAGAWRTKPQGKAGRRGARNERHAGRTCLSFGWPVGLRAMRARAMGNAPKISAAAGGRNWRPASAETEPTFGYYPNHTPPA